MKFTPYYFYKGLPEWKRKKDPITSRLFYRPISFLFSALFASIGLTANAVSLISLLVGLVACSAFALQMPVIGAVLVNLWLVLDCADGNIARCVRAEKYGEFVDAVSGYILLGLLFPCIGLCTYFTGGLLFSQGDPALVFLGSLASSFDILSRLAYQKYQVVGFGMGVNNHADQNPENVTGVHSLRIKIDANLSLGGILPAVMFVFALVGWLDIGICVWCAYCFLVFIVTVAYLMLKTLKANRSHSNPIR